METLQFEAVKVAMKQDRTGMVLTLSIHPDEIPNELMRDFVGARYQVVMVRIGDNELPVTRQKTNPAVVHAGIVCREKEFHAYLVDIGEALQATEADAVDALHRMVGIASRAELKTDAKAVDRFEDIVADYEIWKDKNGKPPF